MPLRALIGSIPDGGFAPRFGSDSKMRQMEAAYERTLAKLAALATDLSAATNERDVARSKFDRVAARYGVTVSIEQFLAGHLREVTHIRVARSGSREAWSQNDTATGWNPARFENAPCPHGCGTLVYLVPQYRTRRSFVSVAGARISKRSGWAGGTHDELEVDYHDDACPVLARQKVEARALAKKEWEERRAAWDSATAERNAANAADPTLLEREMRRQRASQRELDVFKRHEAEAAKRAQSAASAAEEAYWREVEAKKERTRRWRAANLERARTLNREAQARWRERNRIAKAATAVTITDQPARTTTSSRPGGPSPGRSVQESQRSRPEGG
jgi:hypothetical protein